MSTNGDCIIWEGRVGVSGYGRRGSHFAHRLAYEAAIGPIPEGLVVDHLCFNKLCVNPVHLEAVTQQENVRRSIPRWPSALKQHCKNGHRFSDENTYLRPGGSKGGRRQCRICNRAAVARYKQRRSA